MTLPPNVTRWSLLFETGWVGFGWCGGLIPELRLGIVRLSVCRGWMTDAYRKSRDALASAVRGIGGNP